MEAPEVSCLGCWAGCVCGCFGLIPEVEGVRDECGVLVAGDVLEPELGGEAVVVLEELREELYWQEWVPRLLLMGPEVEVLEQRCNCIGTQELCLLLQSGTCRCPRFRRYLFCRC